MVSGHDADVFVEKRRPEWRPGTATDEAHDPDCDLLLRIATNNKAEKVYVFYEDTTSYQNNIASMGKEAYADFNGNADYYAYTNLYEDYSMYSYNTWHVEAGYLRNGGYDKFVPAE